MHDSFERPYESLVLPFAERVMWKDPYLQPAMLNSSCVCVLCLERSETSNAHLVGKRVDIVVARTIRRLLALEREDSNLVVAMRGTPVAGRPADAAAGDAAATCLGITALGQPVQPVLASTASGQHRFRSTPHLANTAFGQFGLFGPDLFRPDLFRPIAL